MSRNRCVIVVALHLALLGLSACAEYGPGVDPAWGDASDPALLSDAAATRVDAGIINVVTVFPNPETPSGSGGLNGPSGPQVPGSTNPSSGPGVSDAGGFGAGSGVPSSGGNGGSTTGSSGTGTGASSPGTIPGTSVADAGSGTTTGAGAGSGTSTGTTGSTEGEGPSTGGGACLNGITDFGNAGPFRYQATAKGAVKMWVPTVPAGCKVPVIHLANGTGANCLAYQASLTRLASHGFLATCYESTNTGAGTQGVMAFEAALSSYPDLADHRLGSTGHSQGGQAAFTVLQQAEAKWGTQMIYAGLAMEPASGFGAQPPNGPWQQVYAKIRSPMFMFSGTADILVSEAWVSSAFAALNDSIEAYWWSAIGATHIPVPNPQEMEISVPWFRWKLLGDKAACEYFKKLPGAGRWQRKKEQNVAACQ